MFPHVAGRGFKFYYILLFAEALAEEGKTWIMRDCSALLPGTKLCTTSWYKFSLVRALV